MKKITPMTNFPNAREAKEFLVSEIADEAQRENVPLSDVERKMLYFSETHWAPPDIMEVNDAFDREYDQTAYEKKIAELVRNRTKRLRKEQPEDFADWVRAIRQLEKEDHYILVMVHQAGVSARRMNNDLRVVILALLLFSGIWLVDHISHYLGIWLPGGDDYSGSSRTNVRLSNLVGYAVVVFAVLAISASIFSFFDRKRRLSQLVDRLLRSIRRRGRHAL
jgi:hypothetical protein